MATKLVLNNVYDFNIDSYNRYTNIDEDRVMSHASVGLSEGDQYEMIELASKDVITDLKIYDENNIQIYHLGNQNAKITNISESLNPGRVLVSMQITFNMNVNAQE